MIGSRFVRASLLAGCLAGCAVTPPPGPVPVRLIGINDFHGNLESTGLSLSLADPAAPTAAPLRVAAGGAAALAGIVQRLRAGARNSMMVASGDLIGGAPLASLLFRDEPAVEILGDVGLEVSSLGNHEFDGGVEELRRIIEGGCAAPVPGSPVASCVQSRYAGARFRYIAANVRDAGGRPVVAPYAIRRFEDIPVGFIGAVTRVTPVLVPPAGVAGLTFGDEADAVNRAADELRAKGVRAMVLLVHEGIQQRGDWNDTSCPGANGALLDIAGRLAPEIKIVFSGHTHQGYRCEIGGRLLIQGTSAGRGVSVVDVELDRATAALSPSRSINLPVLNEHTEPAQRAGLAAAALEPFAAVLRDTQPDAAVAAKVASYVALARPLAQRPIGSIGGTFGAARGVVDNAAGRLIADAQLAATRGKGAQIAFMNPGGIRASLECAAAPCKVTFGDVFLVQPFGNSLITMTFTGAQLKAVLESQATAGPPDRSILQPSQGFTYTWRSDAPAGNKVSEIRLNGEPIRPEARYRVTVNSFLAAGGDGFALFKEGADPAGGGQDLDALIAYLAAAERTPVASPRITRLP